MEGFRGGLWLALINGTGNRFGSFAAPGVSKSRIALLGGGRNLGPSQIRYVWAVDRRLKTTVTPLWGHNLGTIDWDSVMNSINECDVVLTAPSYTGEDPGAPVPHNQHNAGTRPRLTANPRFRGRSVSGWVDSSRSRLMLCEASLTRRRLESRLPGEVPPSGSWYCR